MYLYEEAYRPQQETGLKQPNGIVKLYCQNDTKI